MDIEKLVLDIRGKVKKHGKYREIALSSGVGYEWLAKFAAGAVDNPTVNNVAKLQIYFSTIN